MSHFLSALNAEGFTGDILTDYATRIVNATDNSIYQCLPEAVIAPKSEEDIDRIAACLARFPDTKLTPRGGGTGTNGQSLNFTVIADFSRHLRSILAFDKEAQTVTVQPGVILDELNAFLKPHGLFFPPTVSPSNRATIGGMVSTDACGKGSRIYGKTSDYIAHMEAILPNGASIHSPELQQSIHDALAGFTPPALKLPRGITGYNLKDAANIHALIAGSEGTLALIKRITLRLKLIPKHKALVILCYDDFFKCLEAVPELLTHNPLAIETLDDKILGLAKGDYLWHEAKRLLDDEHARAVHFVEFAADDIVSLNAALEPFEARGYRIVRDTEEMASLWNIRKRCVGLLGNVQGNRRPIPFIEDTAVPPENLPAYIRELRAFLDSHGLDCGMFGHVDAGCLHVRPALDLRLEQDARFIRILSDGVADIVQKHGGIIWGEHGKGFRAEYVEQLLGTDYAAAMARIKQLFDPHNQLNPGKLVNPTPLDAVPLRGEFDRQISPELNAIFPKATQCNGNGACFNYDPHDAMCPSYKATGNRIHSPKGRAALLREWTRLESIKDPQADAVAKLTYDALGGCLSCKACTAQCPIQVNIPDMKSRFLSLYHRKRRRPLRDYVIAHMETLSALGARLPAAANLLLPLMRLIGLIDLPLLKVPARLPEATEQALTRAPKNTVILVQDSFSRFYNPALVSACSDALKALGFTPLLAPWMPNGKPLHVKGFLRRFDTVSRRNAEHLKRLAAHGYPLVGMEPSVTLTYRQEYAAGPDVVTLDEFLHRHRDRILPALHPQHYRLFLHCTEKTAMPESPARWKQVLEKAGHTVEIAATGCCGMAGSYGHEAHHRKESLALFDTSWREALLDASAIPLATGFSCRSQAARLAGIQPAHPISAILLHPE